MKRLVAAALGLPFCLLATLCIPLMYVPFCLEIAEDSVHFCRVVVDKLVHWALA